MNELQSSDLCNQFGKMNLGFDFGSLISQIPNILGNVISIGTIIASAVGSEEFGATDSTLIKNPIITQSLGSSVAYYSLMTSQAPNNSTGLHVALYDSATVESFMSTKAKDPKALAPLTKFIVPLLKWLNA
jgi:hypothetical protein